MLRKKARSGAASRTKKQKTTTFCSSWLGADSARVTSLPRTKLERSMMRLSCLKTFSALMRWMMRRTISSWPNVTPTTYSTTQPKPCQSLSYKIDEPLSALRAIEIPLRHTYKTYSHELMAFNIFINQNKISSSYKTDHWGFGVLGFWGRIGLLIESAPSLVCQ